LTSRTRGERVIAFIERYCIVPEGTRVGLPMVLEDFQKRWILAVYDNPAMTEVAILSIAKKNGKTGLIASILLAHLAGPEAVQNSQIVCGAMSRDQASIVFDYAAKMIGLSSVLSAVVRIVASRKRMYGLARNVEFRALAADAKRTQGISPVVAILDEVGQVKGPKSEFVDAIVTAQGAYDQALLIMISTQAASDLDLLSIEIDDALTGEDPHKVCHLYTAPKGCELSDEEAWAAANPALGSFRSYTDLKKLVEKARRIPSFAPTVRNLNLNQRVEATSPYVTQDVWKSGAVDPVPHEGLYPVWAGLDLSAINDLTAWVGIWKAAGRWNVACRFWAPEVGLLERVKRDRVPYDVWAKQGLLTLTPGPTVDYDFVARDILEMSAGMKLQAMAFDRWRIEIFKAALKRQEASDAFVDIMKPFGQGFASMSPAMDALETEFLASRVAHGGHPILTMCAANAVVVKDAADGRKLTKRKSIGRIDGMVALVMAAGACAENMIPAPEPTYQSFVIGARHA
jgi:phage terminase large subunit-like protein